MATTTLPRPSMGPPTVPLPSLPIPKTRKSTSNTNSPSSALPPSQRSVTHSGSSLPTRSPLQARKPTTVAGSNVPTPKSLNVSTSTPTPAGQRPLRKTISIGSFPQPPKSLRTISQTSSPASANASPVDYRAGRRTSAGGRSSSSRESSRKATPRNQNPGRVGSLRTYSNTPSLLNGGGDKSVSLLNLPSPPHSRASSPHGSYVTQFEEDMEDGRGRTAGDDRSEKGKDGKGNVLVSVRVRPDVSGGEPHKSDLEWMVDGRRSLIGYRGREGGEYIYDNVFTVHDNNSKVYDSAAKRLVRRVMEGYHGTVFAYGMTGTGKTFSMQGTASSPGVIPLAITDIFSFIRETPEREFLLRVSYLEIYNERIHDLLAGPIAGVNGQPQAQEEIKLREDSKRGVYATPLKEEIVQSPTQLLRVIARGDNARRVAGTQYNARSSRSHAVVQIVVESRERAPGSAADMKRQAMLPGGVRVSTLSLIDLAGSERAAENKERRTEGAHINKSLLTLGTVISKLSGDKDKESKGPAQKDNHLPYRDSKLTRLLQPALRGNSLISILCTIQIGSAGSVASAQNHTGETLNTLKFASRAKNNIVSHAKKAEEAYGAGDAGSRALLDRYRMEIADLRKQLDQAKEKDAERDVKEEIEREQRREMQAEQRHEEQMLEMQLARTALKERIEHLNRLILSSKSIGVNSNRSYSSLSMRHASGVTNPELIALPRSARSSATLEPMLSRSASGSIRSFRQSSASAGNVSGAVIAEGDAEDEDSHGENGDGTATSAAQIRALQADLADRNRYISTLEKRLLQARRSSHSRVSMQFSPRLVNQVQIGDGDGVETLLREKDAEIADLRARLDDKERMVSALRSAARKRDVADLTLDTSQGHAQPNCHRHGSASSMAVPAVAGPHGNRVGINRSSDGSLGSGASSEGGSRPNTNKPNSPVAAGAAATGSPVSPVGTGVNVAEAAQRRAKNVDEMTRLLDEMITERVAHNRGNGSLGEGRVDSAISVKGVGVVGVKGARA